MKTLGVQLGQWFDKVPEGETTFEGLATAFDAQDAQNAAGQALQAPASSPLLNKFKKYATVAFDLFRVSPLVQLGNARIDKTTPLHLAVERGNVTTLEDLVHSGIDVNAPDQNGNTPLHLAALRSDSLELVRKLTALNANLNARNKLNRTPLHLAAGSNTLPIVEELIRAGAHLNALDYLNVSPLDLALHLNHIAALKVLITAGADLKRTPPGVFFEGEIVSGADLNKANSLKQLNPFLDSEPIKNYFKSADLPPKSSKKRLVLLKKIESKAKKWNYLYESLSLHNLEALQLFLEAGISSNTKGKGPYNYPHSPLHYAVLNCPKAVSMLTNAGADANVLANPRKTAILYDAVGLKLKEAVRELIAAGADVDVGDENGSLLTLAFNVQEPEIFQILLDAGADPRAPLAARYDTDLPSVNNDPYASKLTLLYGALQHIDKSEAMRSITLALIKADTDLNTVFSSGFTYLNLAIHDMDLEMIIALIKAGVNVNQANGNGLSSLSYLASVRNKKSFKLRPGIDLEIKRMLEKAGSKFNH